MSRYGDQLLEPVRALVDRLAADGATALSRQLADGVAPVIGLPLIRPSVIEAVESVAHSQDVNPVTLQLAFRVVDGLRHPAPFADPIAIVYIVWDSYDDRWLDTPKLTETEGFYHCSWGYTAETEADLFESIEVATLDEAVTWARTRCAFILVRPPWDTNNHYIATDAPPAEWTRSRGSRPARKK
jgi:hypothetical protein